MPTFSTQNSTNSYTVPSPATRLYLIIRGGRGGDGGDAGGGSTNTGGTGGSGGELKGELPVTAGETFTGYVGEGVTGRGGGQSPLNSAGDGGQGCDGNDPSGSGGGGGAESTFRRDSDSADNVADGGGGASGALGEDNDGGNLNGGGGGGGGRGGTGGSSFDCNDGQNATGTGNGGNGADASGSDGGTGGTTAHADLENVSTSTNFGDAEIIIVEGVVWSTPGLSVTSTASSADLSWNDANFETTFEIHRSTSSGFSPSASTQIDSVAADSTSYSDTTVIEGTTYYYKVVAANSESSVTSSEVTTTTTLPAPTSFTVDSTTDTSVDLSWVLNSTDEDGVYVYRSTDGGSTFTQVADLAPGATSYTDSSLLNGTTYTYKVAVYTTDTESESGTDSGTTVLPDVSAPGLGNGVEDEIAVAYTVVTNTGSVRVQARETGESTWDSNAVGFENFTVAYDAGSATVTGREDGEEYEVRIRSETADVDGTWTSPVSIITLFPGAANPTVTATTTTSVDLSWTDNADNELGQEVIREQLVNGTYWPQETLADVGPDITTYTDNDVSPGTTYRYRIRSYTDDTDAISSTVVATSDTGTNVSSDAIPPAGYAVMVEALDGTIRTPQVIGEPTPQPQLNDYPEIEIPVRRDESWTDDKWDQATLYVWRDGERLPIDALEIPEMQPNQTVLHGFGGRQLDPYISSEYSFTTVHDVFQDLLSNETSYTADIDDPGGDTNVQMHDLSTAGDFSDAMVTDSSVEPVNVDTTNDQVTLARTCYGFEGEAADTGTFRADTFYTTPPDFSDNATGAVDDQDIIHDFEVEYEISASDLDIRLRRRLENATGEMAVYIDGEVVHGDTLGANDPNSESLQWVSGYGSYSYAVNPGSGSADEPASPTLEPGTHTIQIAHRDFDYNGTLYSASGFVDVDYVAIYDSRYTPDFPNTTDSNDQLSGPQDYPPSFTPIFEEQSTLGAITAADLSTTWLNGNVSGAQAIALTNDQGLNWQEATNTNSLSVTFNDLGPSVAFRATLSRRTVDSSTTPTTGDGTQALQTASVTVDTSGSPIIENQVLRGSLLEVFQELANRGDVIFEIQIINGDMGVVVTYPGQRSSDTDMSDLIDYSVKKKPWKRVSGLHVRGRSRTVTREQFTADNVGTSLNQNSILEGSETVIDPDTGTTFVRGDGEDYTMAYDIGEISRETGSSMTDGATYEIDYKWQPSATYVLAPVERTRQVFIPELFTNEQCKEAAYYLVSQLSKEPWSATVTIPAQKLGFGLADEINPDELPGTGAYRVRSLNEDPSTIRFELGRGRTIEEEVEALRSRISSTEKEL